MIVSEPSSSKTEQDNIVECLRGGKPVRETIADGSVLHIDRPLPFLCVHETGLDQNEQAARSIAFANASYLIASDLSVHADLIKRIGTEIADQLGAFLIIEISELAADNEVTEDSPYTPPFDITISSTAGSATDAAVKAITDAINAIDALYRSPSVTCSTTTSSCDFPKIHLSFAPIYLQAEGAGIYPELRKRLVQNIFDALLHGVEAFGKASGLDVPSTHRGYARRAYVDAVKRLDRQIDDISRSFNFLLAVTPINSDAAFSEFESSGHSQTPRLLYRSLTVDVSAQKRDLFSISFENLEDPLLYDLYREKQLELEQQLSLLEYRGTPRFRDASRLFYGEVTPELSQAARDILALPKKKHDRGGGGLEGHVDCDELHDAATEMIDRYRSVWKGFDAKVEVRDDLPAGMMVSGPTLMISSSSRMSRRRVPALLSHEIGVHLLTYFAGDAQGLALFRSGLAGYESVQEGLAVFAEYLVGGLTQARLRLLAARVVACEGMLDGAEFPETYAVLRNDYGFSDSGAFNLTLRIHRSGGFAKDAIYLQGLSDVLLHLKSGKELRPYWMGKFATNHFEAVSELGERGLLFDTGLEPLFLNEKGGAERLMRARAGLSPADLIT